MSTNIILDSTRLADKLGNIHIYIKTLKKHDLLEFDQVHAVLKNLSFSNKHLRYCFFLNHCNEPLPKALLPLYQDFIDRTLEPIKIRDRQLLHFKMLEGIYKLDRL